MSTWRQVPGFPRYMVSDDGCVSGPHGLLAQRRRTKDGYLEVRMTRGGKRHTKAVHRLVLLAFAGEPGQDQQCCHNNGDKYDNRLSNLRWDTLQANLRDRRAHGRDLIGVRNHKAKLDPDMITYFSKLRADTGLSYARLGELAGVAPGTIHAAINGRSWRTA